MVRQRVLALDKNISVHEEQKRAGAKLGMENIRVDSMDEAIAKAKREDFFFIVINADGLEFLPMLPILRSVTPVYIAIITSTPSEQEHSEAIKKGANLYTTWLYTADDNAKILRTLANEHNKQIKRPENLPEVPIEGVLILSLMQRRAFVKDTRVILTKKEFNILYYLMKNKDKVLEFEDILCDIWGENYVNATADTVRNHIKKIRKKLLAASPECDYIKTEHGVGYIFTAEKDKNH